MIHLYVKAAEMCGKISTLRILERDAGYQVVSSCPPILKPLKRGVINGGFGVSIGGVRIVRVNGIGPSPIPRHPGEYLLRVCGVLGGTHSGVQIPNLRRWPWMSTWMSPEVSKW